MHSKIAGRITILLLLFSFFPSQVLAQNRIGLAMVQDGGKWRWTLDLDGLNDTNALLVVFDSSDAGKVWQEKEGVGLGALAEFITPRFIQEFDTFDCLQRSLLEKPDSTLVQNQEDKILGLSGEMVMLPPRARGASQHVRVYTLSHVLGVTDDVLLENETGILLTLEQEAGDGKRSMQWITKGNAIPKVYVRNGDEYSALTIDLYVFSAETAMGISGMKMPERPSWNIPSGAWKQKMKLLEALESSWTSPGQAVLMYSWNLGTGAGNKCEPCTGPPPTAELMKSIGLIKVPETLYFSALRISPGMDAELEPVLFKQSQWVFKSQEAAKGFLNCPEANKYREALKQRQEEESQNLRLLLGNQSSAFE